MIDAAQYAKKGISKASPASRNVPAPTVGNRNSDANIGIFLKENVIAELNHDLSQRSQILNLKDNIN